MRDARAVGQVEVAAGVDGQVVLADLKVLGHVGIEVVLAVERRRRDRAVQRRADRHRQLDRAHVEHRQRARQSQADRADVRVGLGAESRSRSRRTSWSSVLSSVWTSSPTTISHPSGNVTVARPRSRGRARRGEELRLAASGSEQLHADGQSALADAEGHRDRRITREVGRDREDVREVHRHRVGGLRAELEGDRRRRRAEQQVDLVDRRGERPRSSACGPSSAWP